MASLAILQNPSDVESISDTTWESAPPPVAERTGRCASDTPRSYHDRLVASEEEQREGHLARTGCSASVTSRERDLSQGRPRVNPFQRERRHTIAVWKNLEYDEEGEGYAAQDGFVPLYTLPENLLETALMHTVLEDDLAEKLLFDRRKFYVELFFLKRFVSKGALHKARPDLWSLSVAWNAYVGNIQTSFVTWYESFKKQRESFQLKTFLGIKWRVHTLSMETEVGCAVLEEQNCPFCYRRGRKMPDEMRESNVLKKSLRTAIKLLDVRYKEEKQREIKHKRQRN